MAHILNLLNELKNKGVTINPENTKDNNCFQYAIIAALNYQNINYHPEIISKLKPFINKYNWKDIEFPSHFLSFTFPSKLEKV